MGAVKNIGVLQNLVASGIRGPSPSIYQWPTVMNAGPVDFMTDPALGLVMFDDFGGVGITPATGSAQSFCADTNWYAFATTDGTVADAGIVGGGIILSGATTPNQGIALGSLTTAWQLLTSGGLFQGRFAFECSVEVSTASLAASTADMFIGLCDTTPTAILPITATGGVLATDPGLIGFHKRGGATNPGDFNFCFNAAGVGVQYPTNLQNIITTVTGAAPVGGTYYKLGFVFDPFVEQQLITLVASNGQTVGQLARPILKVFVNGVAAAAFLINTDIVTATFPSTVMAKSIAFQQQSTTASVAGGVDWIFAAQTSLT